MRLEIVTLDTSKQDPTTKAPLISAKQPITGDDDVEEFGDLPLMQCLGVTSAPFGKTDSGYCEGVIVHGVGARDGVIIGARDTRTVKAIGTLEPGDTVLHSTGPNMAAQIQCKEKKRQAAMVSKTASGKTLTFYLDGKNESANLLTPWGRIEVSEKNGVVLASETGEARIQLRGNTITLTGTLMFGGATPTAVVVGCDPLSAASLPAPLKALPGLFGKMA